MKWLSVPASIGLLFVAACNSDTTPASNPAQSSAVTTPPTPTTPATPTIPSPPTPPPTSAGTGSSASDIPGVTPLDYLALEQPVAGDHALRVISPTVIEVARLSIKQPSAAMDVWNFIDGG